MNEFRDGLVGLGIVGYLLAIIIVIGIGAWAVVSCYRIKYGRKGLAEIFLDLAKYVFSIFRTFWGERKSGNAMERINFRMVIILLMLFVTFMIYIALQSVLSPQSFLAMGQPKDTDKYILGLLVISSLTIVGSGVSVMKHQAWKDSIESD